MPGQLLLYLIYQPCHHSGGHKRQGMGQHGTSCTTLLLRHRRKVLMPRQVGLSLRLAYLYRALTGRAVDERGPGSVAAAALAVMEGASIVRTHDVRETLDAVRVAQAVRGGLEGWSLEVRLNG